MSAELKTKLFTPYIGNGRLLRAYMQISAQDDDAFNSLPEGGTVSTVRVFDTVSQSFYTVRRASCGLECFCAAEIVGGKNDV